MNKYIYIFIVCIFTLFVSCKKEGQGGKAQISGTVRYNGIEITGATVYIKYGATSSPSAGASASTVGSYYDNQQNSDVSGRYSFTSLVKGNYYIYVVGYYTEPATQYLVRVTGGVTAHIPGAKSSVTYDVNLAK